MQLGSTRSERSGKTRFFAVLLLVFAIAFGAWYAFRVWPAPEIDLATERSAVGRSNVVTAVFSEPEHGLGTVRLELIQGDRTELLAEQIFVPGSGIPFFGSVGTTRAVLEVNVGADQVAWLAEGEAVLRATAERLSGPFRSAPPVSIEHTLQVRLRPPRLEVVSTQHYGRQGGSGVVVYRVGEHVVRSGVQAGRMESPGSPHPGGGSNDRFALYALPWNVADSVEIRLFAEDDAGNRAEQPFLDIFKAMPSRTDTIRLSDTFFQKVVPAIASRTPGFDASGSLLDQYLRINGDLRRSELGRVTALSRESEPAFLWSGAFLQMPNSARAANFAEIRSYIYEGRKVDQQTHLGLDLASTAHAPVPAPNSGRVVFAGWMSLYGNAVIVDHGYGLLSLCGHMSTIEVTAGDSVTKGDRIGTSGATGLAGGDHLHLEVFLHGQSVDPMEWIDAKWIRDNLATKLEVPIQ
jgi:murein DD-endopeptidase MepM/ murein hydrolase activator NlpD